MKAILVDGLLGFALLVAWIGAVGFARLAVALDRLHVVAFVTIGSGLPIVLAAFLSDGPSVRAFKLLLLFVVALVAGASVNQTIARAIFTRNEAGERA